MEYSVKILDANGEKIGEKIAASAMDVLAFINKGFIVVDIHTNETLTPEQVSETIGVSDGLITV